MTGKKATSIAQTTPPKTATGDRMLSTSEVSRLLNVAAASIANWVDNGKLQAGRTPGGHRRIKASDLIDFLHRQQLPIPPELNPSPPRILIVDDESSVTDWVSEEMIERHPEYEVISAHDGFAAGEIVGSLHPDVVILDLWMPDLDGFEVCRRIKSRPDGDKITVIAITGYFSRETERRILDCGAVTCLEKPFEINDLLVKVEELGRN